MNDDTVTKFAQRYRLEAAAALVQIVRDERAPPQARAAAAEKILLYSDGRPGAAQPIRVADLELMSDEQRMQLLEALVNHYTPNGFKLLVQQAVDHALAQQPRLPRPNRITRGTKPTPLAN